MSEKTIRYEGPDGLEVETAEDIQYEEELAHWRFERVGSERIEVVRIPRERVYEIAQPRTPRPQTDEEKYGHP